MTREEKEAEREKTDREMQEERRAAARARDDRFADVSIILLLSSTMLTSYPDGPRKRARSTYA